jgi:phosphoglycerate dehydrogenase-like enzyme
VPLSPATHHLIDSVAIARMKPSAYLINTARGGVLDQAALRDALQRRQLAGAALDVTDPEPLPDGHPLWSAPGLLITPHVGGDVYASRERAYAVVAGQLKRLATGEPLENEIGPQGY